MITIKEVGKSIIKGVIAGVVGTLILFASVFTTIYVGYRIDITGMMKPEMTLDEQYSELCNQQIEGAKLFVIDAQLQALLIDPETRKVIHAECVRETRENVERAKRGEPVKPTLKLPEPVKAPAWETDPNAKPFEWQNR